MGLGRLFERTTTYNVTDTVSGQSQTFSIGGGIAPDWFAGGGEYQGGMGIPAAWRAANLKAGLLGSFPWNAYRTVNARPVKILPVPALLEQPAPPDVRITTISSMALDFYWHGNGIGIVATRNAEGWPTSCVPVSARGVEVKRAERQDPFPLGTVMYRVGDNLYGVSDVLHFKGPCAPGALRGMGVIECHLASLQLSAAQARQAGSLSDAAVPTGVLEVDDPDLDKDEAEDLKADWRRSQATRSVAVLPQGHKFVPLAWNPSETQLLDARKFDLLTWALIFGLPPGYLGAENGSKTYRTAETESLDLVKFHLGADLARFEQEFTRHFPRGTWAQANLDSLLRSDTETRYKAHEIGIRAGFLTDDEARELEDRPPLTPAQRAQRVPVAAPPPAESAPDDEEERARNAGGNYPALHAYWTRGEGLARWRGQAEPWFALYTFLRRHISPDRKARGTASRWFKEVVGRWPTADDGYEEDE
jgi:HK97 family phage portal protein